MVMAIRSRGLPTMSAVKMKQNTVTFTGKVMRKRIAPRSKSDRMGVVLENEDGRWYVLRRAGGNPFRDRALDHLVGKMITATGIVSGRSLIMSDWAETTTSHLVRRSRQRD
jgi:hypothetical protein